ncbi:MAG: hypothetical protein KME19_08910 [Microcoleus vaginatus WJT46-NPBG5]|jgi:hypothetical protein|nr:hypothetical protein [Microcoleus vaginatus WJT46-NPBG5]MBW4680220.1 hypothetical protein [Microcoleus vaginatus WJT46-NPBG5]
MTNEPSKELMEEISGLQKIYAQAFKQEYVIDIVTELITPVAVEAFTQEEAEHLALEKFKLAADAGERETSESLERLWSVIGVGGSRLNFFNKLAFVEALSNLAWKQSPPSFAKLSLWSTLSSQWDKGNLAEMPNTIPPITADNLEEVFSAITLSERDCWQVISEIAATQLARGVSND